MDGEHKRDFIFVGDVNLWFYDHPDKFGIVNVGSGQAETFNAVAQAVIHWHGKGKIEYIPFPEHLIVSYQSYTQADISELREAGYGKKFLNVNQGVNNYLDLLNGAN